MVYSIELKVKRKSLADEARIIRREEKRMKAERNTEKLTSLHEHRINVVRPAARAANLAHGYLLGQAYVVLERTTRTRPPVLEVRKLVSKYGPQSVDPKDLEKALLKWVTPEEAVTPVGA